MVGSATTRSGRGSAARRWAARVAMAAGVLAALSWSGCLPAAEDLLEAPDPQDFTPTPTATLTPAA